MYLDIIHENVPPVTNILITQGERDLLSDANAHFLYIDEMCLGPLVQKSDALRSALEPYGSPIKDGSPTKGIPRQEPSFRLIPYDAIHDFALSFQYHPGVIAIRRILRDRRPEVKPNDLLHHVITLRKAINDAGPTSAPDFLQALLDEQNRSAEAAYCRLTAAVLSVRESLYVKSQLLWQSISYPRIKKLSDDDIIWVSDIRHHIAGEGAELIIAPNPNNASCEPGDVVYIAGRKLRYLAGHPYVIETAKVSLSKKTGNILKIGIRKIDTNLNPFIPLAKFAYVPRRRKVYKLDQRDVL